MPNGLTFSREPRVDSFGTWIYVARGSAAAMRLAGFPVCAGPGKYSVTHQDEQTTNGRKITRTFGVAFG